MGAFTADVTSGCAILKVTFTDKSTNNPTGWHWDFGDGQTSDFQNPVHFFDPGTWTVTFIAENGNGASTPVTQVITVSAKPTATFATTGTTGCYPLGIQFTDQSSIGVVKWEWDFGDGNVSTDRNPYHIYKQSGTFVASLKATNAAGCSDFSKPTTVTINNGVKADYTNTVSQSCKPPALVTFTNTSQEYGTMSYFWDFGDGSTDTRPNPPPHTYTQVKSYTVTLIAKSDQGCVDTLTGNNQINIVNSVTSDFTYANGACSGVATTLTNTSSPQPFTAVWDFGDGTPTGSGAATVSHIFPNDGTFNVKLVNNFGNCIDSTTKPVTIVAGSNVGFTAVDTLNCKIPTDVVFTDTTKGSPNSWSWNFGDGISSTQQNPTHRYTRAGLFNVTLSVKNGNGCAGTKTIAQYVKVGVPTAAIIIPKADGCNTLDINAKADVTTVDGVASYRWQFGDGTADFTSTTSPNVTHHYGTLGTYTLTLTVTTKGGCTATATQKIEIGTPPTLVDFTVSDVNPCAGSAVSFTDLSKPSPGINRWSWDFGDGNSSVVQNPIYKYSTDNNNVPYDVTLTVYNNGCPATLKKTGLIKVKPPVAGFTYQINCNNKQEYFFTDKSSPGSSISWDFGDGSPIVNNPGSSPKHTYPALNKAYNVVLKAVNGNCTNSDTLTVYTLSADSAFAISPASPLCRRTYTLFTTAAPSAAVSSYTWDFGDGTAPIVTPNYAVGKFYDATGSMTATLTITDTNNCSSSTHKSIVVKGIKPTFNISPTQACIGTPITVANTTTGDNSSTTWNWTFGDGTSYGKKDPPSPYTYSKQGLFLVKLIVSDGGCVDSMLQNINITQPYTAFSADTASCPGATVSFLNTSTGNTLTYVWNFGDGQSSTKQNPTHTYASNMAVPALRNVVLNARDANGCSKDTALIIKFDKPTISFTPTTGTTNCPPLAMDFTSTSHYVTTYDWDFGDGAHSSSANPSHTYYYPNDAPGYIVKLTGTSPGGCTASLSSQPITIFGPQGDFSFSPASACVNSTINFTVANAKGVKTYNWDFNDGASNATTTPASSHVYTTAKDYNPRVILEDATGCQVPITSTNPLKIIGITPKFTFNPATLCDSGTVVFKDASTSNGNITGYSWTFGDGGTGTGNNAPHYYAIGGGTLNTYSVTLNVSTTAPACVQSVTYKDTVKVYQSPYVLIQGAKEACEPATLTFNGFLINPPNYPPITWSWDFGNGQTATGQNPPAQTFAAAGNYNLSLQATNAKGCTGKSPDPYIVTIHPLPKTFAGIDSLICLGETVQLQASGADSYNWIGPSTSTLSCTACPSPIATPSQTTDYFVRGTTTFGCSNQDTVRISVNLPVHILVDPVKDSLCIGQSAQLRAVGAAIYNWTPAAGLSSTTISNPVAKPDVSTVYKVVASDSKSCFFDSAYVDLTVFKYPTIELGPDASIPSGGSYQINGQGSSDIVNVSWKPTVGLSCDNCLNPVASPVKTTNYIATVTNNGNCSVADNITVVVYCNDQNFFMPNTFSPNNDGTNDVFYPRGKGLTRINTFRIYNRLGQLIFEKQNFTANDVSAGWNGTINGEKAPQDVYTYIIEFVCNNSQVIPYKGNVSLIR